MADRTRVLVIDDDPDTLDVTGLFLRNRGYEVITSSTPDEGTRQLEQAKPDVVVLDIMIPEGTEGFHWLWALRRHTDPGLRDLPVIVVSAISGRTGLKFREGESDETGSYLPAQAFMDKPIDPDELAAKIESVLGRSG